MGPAPRVGPVFFPLDEELALLPGRLTPQQQEHLAHLATWMPFERAVQMLERLLGIQVSEPTVRRGTLRAGRCSQEHGCIQSQSSCQRESVAQRADKHVMSVDGAYVPLIKGEWAEVRTVAIGEVEASVNRHGEHKVHTSHLSYFSRMTDAQTFGDLAEGELSRRGVGHTHAVCAVTDGADWIQGFVDLHRPDAVRILDFPHAAEHLSVLIEALRQAGVSLPPNVFERCLHVLKHRGPGLLLRWFDRLPAAIKEREEIQRQEGYMRKRIALMDYPSYQRHGWPIGSGMVESANKLVVQARLKGAGMHWQRRHVNPMLALRNAVCNERWSECWQGAVRAHHDQRFLKCQQRAREHAQQLLSSFLHLLLLFQAPTPAPVTAPSPPAKPHASLPATEPRAMLPGSSRPSPHHIWKRMPACRPKQIAKK